jgi:hypothetical protein
VGAIGLRPDEAHGFENILTRGTAFAAQGLPVSGRGYKEHSMATHIVMDQTGDTRHEFDPQDAEALARRSDASRN